MLQIFRDNLKSLSFVLWIVILAFVALVFVEVNAFGPAGPGGRSAKAAWAGDISVTYSEYEREYRRLEGLYRQFLKDGFTPEMADRLKVEALDNSLNRKILQEEARELGLTVSDAELQDEILAVPGMTDEAGAFIGDDMYQRVFRYYGFRNASEFEDAMRDQVIQTKLDEILRQSVYVSAAEVESTYRERVDRAKVRYILQQQAAFAGDVQVGTEDLEAYYQSHLDSYLLPERRVISYLLVDNARLRNQMEISEEELRSYYDGNQEEFNQEEQVRARHILLRTEERDEEAAKAELQALRQRIEGGEDFAALAREFSEDPGSKTRGGDLNFFARGRMVPEFEEAAFSAQVGDLVGPFASPFGAHLLEVTDRRPAGLQPFEEVQGQIRFKLQGERLEPEAEAKVADVLTRLQELETVDAEALRDVAGELEYASLNSTQPFGQTDLIPGVGRSEEFSSAAFALAPGELSDPIKISRGWAVLTLDEVQDARTQELSEVEGTVRQAVRQEKLQTAAMDALSAARERLEAGQELDQVAQELGLEVKESDEFGRTGSIQELGTSSARLVREAFDLEVGQVGGPFEYTQGAALFQVAERKSFDPAEFAEQQEETQVGLEQERYQRLVSALIEERRRELNVQYASQIVQEAGLDQLQ